MKFSIYSFVVLVLFSLPVFVFAGKALDYTPLQTVTMPNSTKPLFDNDLLKYLANIYTLIIALAGALAVVKIVYAGIKYMTSEAFGLKAEAKKEIQAALIGLLMILGSYVFLYTLNPKLTIFNLKIVSTKAIVGDGKDLYNWPESNPALAKFYNASSTTQTKGVPNGLVGSAAARAIVEAAQYAIDHPTLNQQCSATENGVNGCAYAVNEIVSSALGAPAGGELSVANMHAALDKYNSDPNGRFYLVDGGMSESLPGDIMILGNNKHVVIVETPGAKTALGNSSYEAPRSEDANGNYYLKVTRNTDSYWNTWSSTTIYRPR